MEIISTHELSHLLDISATAITKRIAAGTLPPATHQIRRPVGAPVRGWRRSALRKVLKNAIMKG